MTKKYEIALKYIKDLSIEIPDAKTFLFSKEYITKYSLGINVTTKPMKSDMIEVITKLHYKIRPTINKVLFEISYATVKIVDKNLKKEELEKIILIEVQQDIYPELEKNFLRIIKSLVFQIYWKKVDFEKLYNQKFN